jgi:hypothetical protein
LLLQNLLGFGISEPKKQFVSVLASDVMELFDHMLRNFTAFETEDTVSPESLFVLCRIDYRANPTSLLTPVFSSRLIFSDTTR